jgi:hypothetical protein
MTIPEFLAEVERVRCEPCRGVYNDTGARFHVEDGKYIQSDEELCPIHEVAWRQDEEVSGEDVYEKGRKLGLSDRSIQAIIQAADGKTSGRLRQKLLKACGIKA